MGSVVLDARIASTAARAISSRFGEQLVARCEALHDAHSTILGKALPEAFAKLLDEPVCRDSGYDRDEKMLGALHNPLSGAIIRQFASLQPGSRHAHPLPALPQPIEGVKISSREEITCSSCGSGFR